jgi:hypothetical protein
MVEELQRGEARAQQVLPGCKPSQCPRIHRRLLVLLVYFHQPELYSENPAIQPDFKVMRIDRRYANTLKLGFTYSLLDFSK